MSVRSPSFSGRFLGSKLWFVILMRMKTQWLWWCVRTGHGNKNIQGFSPLSPPLAPPLVWSIVINLKKRLGYVCNPRSLKEGTETSRRKTDVLGVRLERPLHFECKLNEPMHIGMRLLHPAAADHSVSISRQQEQRIFRFSMRSRPGEQPLRVVQEPWRRDVTSEDRRFGIPTKRPRILPLPVSRGSLRCPYFLAQVRAPTRRPVTVAMALPTQ